MSRKTGLTAVARAVASCLALAPAPVEGQAILILLFGDKLSTESLQVGINADVTFSGATGLEGSSSRTSWAFGAHA